MSTFRIGLTGGIGSGKTAASAHFEKLGIDVIDADIVAREVVEPEQPALSKIAEHFGAGILSPDGHLDRKKLRHIVFKDSSEKNWLEALLHPLIRERIQQQLADAASAYSILVSPLLFETDQHNLVDRTLLIDLPVELQIERASQRDGADPEQIRAIIQQQMSRECKSAKADDIILNSSDLAALHAKVEQFHKKYLGLINEQATN